MRRLIGFALFFVAVGIILGNVISGKWCDLACIMFCFFGAYLLFFS